MTIESQSAVGISAAASNIVVQRGSVSGHLTGDQHCFSHRMPWPGSSTTNGQSRSMTTQLNLTIVPKTLSVLIICRLANNSCYSPNKRSGLPPVPTSRPLIRLLINLLLSRKPPLSECLCLRPCYRIPQAASQPITMSSNSPDSKHFRSCSATNLAIPCRFVISPAGCHRG